MTENIAHAVNEALSNDPPPTSEPVSITTERLIRILNALDGARFDDVYPHVMEWSLTRDRNVT